MNYREKKSAVKFLTRLDVADATANCSAVVMLISLFVEHFWSAPEGRFLGVFGLFLFGASYVVLRNAAWHACDAVRREGEWEEKSEEK